jgi:hypothetical protein
VLDRGAIGVFVVGAAVEVHSRAALGLLQTLSTEALLAKLTSHRLATRSAAGYANVFCNASLGKIAKPVAWM